jgi:hypothetical protein
MIIASTIAEAADAVDMRFESMLFRKCDLAVCLSGDQEVVVLGVCGLCFGSLPGGLRDELSVPFMVGATLVLTGPGG